jgi:hypothetical protein
MNRDGELGADAPRLDPWLVMMLLAIVPMLAALVVRDLVMHLAAISGILFAAGVAMLLPKSAGVGKR